MSHRTSKGSAMIGRQPYTYVLLRYRHDPLAEEFVNVGVVLHAPKSRFVGVKVRKTVGRLSKMFPLLDRRALSSALTSIERSVLKFRPSSESDLFSDMAFELDAAKIANQAMPADDSSYLWSALRSGITNSPDDTIDKLYARFVSAYDEESRYARDDGAVWQPVRDQLAAKHLLDKLQPKRIISSIDEVEFENAWKNGAWHCYQALSFDLASPENIRDKAARWCGHMSGIAHASEEVKPHFVVGAPSDPALDFAYRQAIQLLRGSALAPEVFEEFQSNELVQQIEAEMLAHETEENANREIDISSRIS